MTTTEFKNMILERFGHTPTADQKAVLDTFAHFLAWRERRPLMILRGSAGTGKTSLVAAMVQTLKALGQTVVLMAPTGRAAKVLGDACGMGAQTIHRTIYRQKQVGGDFDMGFNPMKNALYVVDEASMIGRSGGDMSGDMPMFGSNGSGLLDDVVTFVYSGHNCRMLMIGDAAQLPPVGELEAPALNVGFMEGYDLQVLEADLNMVVRQKTESGILWNAMMLRQMVEGGMSGVPFAVKVAGFPDVVVVNGSELIESIGDSYGRVGEDETIVITRSNKMAGRYNVGIRNTILDSDSEVGGGDRVMIVRNHYFHAEEKEGQQTKVAFIANGDVAVVKRVRGTRELYGHTFADVTLSLPDYDIYDMEMTAVLDTLYNDSPCLTAQDMKQLHEAVMEDYSDVPRKADRLKKVREDVYYNALQLKFAYAVTCHKAQGGQWRHVYVDQGYMPADGYTNEYYHWLYTAFTRATERLYLVNWPKDNVES